VVLTKAGHSAVFLPQVAEGPGWTVEEMLMHRALKAGIDSEGWKSGCEFRVFEAMVFSEI
jgi:AMMECR1 domain-containing protein